jgi:hypothetical protein
MEGKTVLTPMPAMSGSGFISVHWGIGKLILANSADFASGYLHSCTWNKRRKVKAEIWDAKRTLESGWSSGEKGKEYVRRLSSASHNPANTTQRACQDETLRRGCAYNLPNQATQEHTLSRVLVHVSLITVNRSSITTILSPNTSYMIHSLQYQMFYVLRAGPSAFATPRRRWEINRSSIPWHSPPLGRYFDSAALLLLDKFP